jgi:glucan endo-1,3-alpha-glucosidase
VSYWTSQTRSGSTATIVDGMFNFNTAQLSYGSTPNLIQNTSDYAASLAAANKSFMASFSPYYWGAYQSNAGRRNFNERGGQGMNEQFQAKSANPDWMEILTWNDWAESYMMPIDDFTKYFPSQSLPSCLQNTAGNCVAAGWYQDHRGMAELARYFIQWFKTGVQPTIVTDAVFFSYVPQMSNATITGTDPYGPVGQICSGGTCTSYGLFGDSTDNVYITTAMTAPGFVTWVSGGTHQFQSVPAGLSFVSGPSSPGLQVFSLSRGGVQINYVQGPDIQSSLPLYDYWPATGYVEGPN